MQTRSPISQIATPTEAPSGVRFVSSFTFNTTLESSSPIPIATMQQYVGLKRGKQLQIFRAVVPSFSVLVMDIFLRGQFSTDYFFHDNSVFHNVFFGIRLPDHDIAIAFPMHSTSLPSSASSIGINYVHESFASTFHRTKSTFTSFGTNIRNTFFATGFTDERKGHVRNYTTTLPTMQQDYVN